MTRPKSMTTPTTIGTRRVRTRAARTKKKARTKAAKTRGRTTNTRRSSDPWPGRRPQSPLTKRYVRTYTFVHAAVLWVH